MGDRTRCTLHIMGKFHLAHIATLQAALESAAPNDFHPGETIEQTIRHFTEPSPNGQAPCFHFDEVNYAQMDEDLASALATLKLSWSWSWAPGGDYGEGIIFRDADRDKTAEFGLVHDEIALPLSQLDRAADAHAWQAWYDQATFFAVD